MDPMSLLDPDTAFRLGNAAAATGWGVLALSPARAAWAGRARLYAGQGRAARARRRLRAARRPPLGPRRLRLAGRGARALRRTRPARGRVAPLPGLRPLRRRLDRRARGGAGLAAPRRAAVARADLPVRPGGAARLLARPRRCAAPRRTGHPAPPRPRRSAHDIGRIPFALSRRSDVSARPFRALLGRARAGDRTLVAYAAAAARPRRRVRDRLAGRRARCCAAPTCGSSRSSSRSRSPCSPSPPRCSRASSSARRGRDGRCAGSVSR